MPIDIASLPYSFRAEIIEKMDSLAFINFQKSSKFATNAKIKRKIDCKEVEGLVEKNLKLRHYPDEKRIEFFHFDTKNSYEITEDSKVRLTAEVVELEDELNDEFCELLIKSFAVSQWTVEQIEFLNDAPVTCSYENFRRLLQLLRVQIISDRTYTFPYDKPLLPPEYLKSAKLDVVSIKCPMNDQIMLSLKAGYTWIISSEITVQGVNEFIKEWMHGKRDIRWATFSLEDVSASTKEAVLEEVPHIVNSQGAMTLERNGKDKLEIHFWGDRVHMRGYRG